MKCDNCIYNNGISFVDVDTDDTVTGCIAMILFMKNKNDCLFYKKKKGLNDKKEVLK